MRMGSIISPATSLAARTAAIIERLRALYGSHTPRPDHLPTDSLIATILSQHTSDINSSRAFAALKARYANWHDVLYADPADLADTIRSAGLATIKSMYIQTALAEIERRFGTLDLAFLQDLPLSEACKVLQSLPGVGPKTAACVLLFACGRPALPVDTHIHRVAGRLGIIEQGTTADRAHDVLQTLVPAGDVYDFHVNLISHGRQVCQARRPRCEICALQECCLYFEQHVAPSTGLPACG
jgi:endonuclease-3